VAAASGHGLAIDLELGKHACRRGRIHLQAAGSCGGIHFEEVVARGRRGDIEQHHGRGLWHSPHGGFIYSKPVPI
jgi:hypothetical protein